MALNGNEYLLAIETAILLGELPPIGTAIAVRRSGSERSSEDRRGFVTLHGSSLLWVAQPTYEPTFTAKFADGEAEFFLVNYRSTWRLEGLPWANLT